ncbi:hypothetical protein JCM19300_368 [Algibacter lectus]|uniref:Twin-arginine translocation signal domain-containing protein n=1 Tax=Algibacter lectus TaxID=221126 RepID=A0A090W5A3_9FLAO|nr:hypothetical protein JCM19300_368 [Algibacter lectus]
MESSRRKFIKQTAMGTMGTLIVPQLSLVKIYLMQTKL